MTPPRVPATARLSGEIYNHRLLWHTAEVLYDRGREGLEGSHHYLLAAQLFIYLAFEGFVNFLGAKIAPAEWRNEREAFSREPYRGTQGKLDFLLARLKLDFPKGSRPYQTFREVERRRDYMVHSRPEVVDSVVRASTPAGLPRSKEPELFTHSDPSFVRRAFDDIEDIADRLQTEAQRAFG
jgi:hypothetical protein